MRILKNSLELSRTFYKNIKGKDYESYSEAGIVTFGRYIISAKIISCV